MKTANATTSCRQAGFTLIELMVGIVITMTVMAGVVQMLVVSKSNFVSGRELATTQENARYAMKYLTDEIRMAGFTGCGSTATLDKPSAIAMTMTGATTSWYLKYPGIEGYEYDAGINTFPAEFRSQVNANTDSVVVRRSETTGLRVTAHTNTTSNSIFTVNKAHSFQPGQVLVLTKPNCAQVTVFQMSGSTASTKIEHKIGIVSPGNCNRLVLGNYDCSPSGSPSPTATVQLGSGIKEFRSEAYYIGASQSDSSVPALWRRRMAIVSANTLGTVAEELVKGVENMQILYGLEFPEDPDNPDRIADRYVTPAVVDGKWDLVVSVRLSLRMRSLLPVYNEPVDFGEFEGVTGTDGSDRFMRQDVSTIITLRNN